MASKPQDSSRPDGGGTPGEPVLWNAFANMASLAGHAVTIVRGEGSTVFDDRGRPYLDALASLWYCNVGHGRAELADAAAAQMRQLAAYQTFEPFSNQPAEALARRVAGLAPMPGAKVFFTPGGGSDAVDTAAKLARSYWRALGQDDKQVTIARSHAYHGMNAYGTSLGGDPGQHRTLRSAGKPRRACGLGRCAGAREGDRNSRRPAGGRVLLRAGGRGRRGVPAAGGLPGQRPGDLPAA
jgi:adenosylmethionine-8-amino-7-oxononanoate aminotransferase